MLLRRHILEAIEQMKVQCDLHMANYDGVSARSVLRELGYDGENLEQVIRYISTHGFEYCLDHTVECNSGDPDNNERIYPSPDVCYWGPDQLKSRLNSLKR